MHVADMPCTSESELFNRVRIVCDCTDLEVHWRHVHLHPVIVLCAHISALVYGAAKKLARSAPFS
jgi:hypothetical protein